MRSLRVRRYRKRLVGSGNRCRAAQSFTRPVIAWLLLPMVVLGAACVDRSPTGVRDAEVYTQVVRWFLTDSEASTPIFLDHREDLEIDLAVQAEVVERLADFESVRFVDMVDEAVDKEAPNAPVRGDGVFIRLGSVIGEGVVSVTATRYYFETESVTYSFSLRIRAGEWAIEGSPTPVQSLD